MLARLLRIEPITIWPHWMEESRTLPDAYLWEKSVWIKKHEWYVGCWISPARQKSEAPVVLDLFWLCFFPLMFVLGIHSFLLRLFILSPPHSIPPAHLLKSASTESVPLWPAHITASMKGRFSCPCRILHFFLSWGLAVITVRKWALCWKGRMLFFIVN